jgi:hypothetical protein
MERRPLVDFVPAAEEMPSPEVQDLIHKLLCIHHVRDPASHTHAKRIMAEGLRGGHRRQRALHHSDNVIGRNRHTSASSHNAQVSRSNHLPSESHSSSIDSSSDDDDVIIVDDIARDVGLLQLQTPQEPGPGHRFSDATDGERAAPTVANQNPVGVLQARVGHLEQHDSTNGAFLQRCRRIVRTGCLWIGVGLLLWLFQPCLWRLLKRCF